MSTAQAGRSAPGSHSCREKLFELLADRDPFDVMAQSPSTLADIVREHSATVLRTRPFEGKWAATEVIGHLADSEWV